VERKPNISFVIPAYNAESMLPDAVNSIFDGNFEEGDEVIIVNDASKDGTLAVAQSLAQAHAPHVTVIDNAENRGCPSSRNVGIARAKGELIFNLDADNVLAPQSVGALRETIVRDNADVAAFGEYWYFRTSPRDITHKWICKPGVFTLADFFSGTINQGPGGNFLYRKSTWERIGRYWEYGKGLHEAWGFTLKLLINGARFVVVPDTFYFHRYSHQSLFVRENGRTNEGIRVSNLFIEPALPLLDQSSREYVRATPNWFDAIGTRPLTLADGSRGTDGRLVSMTLAGKLKQALRAVYARISQ